jgi:hypothetical protein
MAPHDNNAAVTMTTTKLTTTPPPPPPLLLPPRSVPGQMNYRQHLPLILGPLPLFLLLLLFIRKAGYTEARILEMIGQIPARQVARINNINDDDDEHLSLLPFLFFLLEF